MKTILVTGAAGFIGSHLCEELLKTEAYQVIGLDAMLDLTTPVWIKERNLAQLMQHPRFQFVTHNLLTVLWEQLLPDVDIVYHLAGMPGVRSSWGDDFVHYARHNILATQRLLEGCRRYEVERFIFASTSSVYGEKHGRVSETATTEPLSPYGITKLTCEHLCRVYGEDEGVPITVLRFFTVYGPRQRPDMAFHRFIRQMLEKRPVTLYGDGMQSRDFTYVDDCVKAIAACAEAKGIIGETLNIGGKERATVQTCISLLEELLQRKAVIQYAGGVHGEPKSTWADTWKAEQLLSYVPTTDLKAGLAKELSYIRDLYVL